MCDKWRFLQKALVMLICLPPLFSTSQHDPFTGKVIDARIAGLNEAFDAYQVYSLDLTELSRYVQSDNYDNHIMLDLPGYGVFEIDLFHNPLKAENYNIKIQTESGVEVIPDDGSVKTFKGYLEGGQYEVRLTIDDDFINGFIELPKDELYFESMRFRRDDAPSDHILVYKKSSITEEFQFACEPLQVPGHVRNEEFDAVAERAVVNCLEVEIGLADDWLMYLERDQVLVDVENHNLAVINNVQVNYDDEFAHELSFNIVQIFVSTCSTCDPWTSSTNSGALLNSFASWGGTGFSFEHDVASLWSDRNFDGPPVGVAWLDAVCVSSFKYNILQDFTANANFLRVLQAHEMGHNFGSGHDPSGSSTIMAPAINNTNDWSASSVNQIDNYVSGISCLADCAAALPPVALIGSDLQEGCIPLIIQFSDLSTGAPDTWNWTFEGGDPGTSNVQNPIVTYLTAGSYDVTLEVFNAVGDDIITLVDYVVVLPDPEADFTYTWDQLTVFFENLSINADSYFWEFGDGNTSTEVNPVYTYAEDGFYDVTLTATNECGDINYLVIIEVVSLPTADFAYNPEEGCVPLIVDFFDLSTENVDDFLWEFSGGSPSSSTQADPVVIYENPGVYGVTLTVSNEAGEDVFWISDAIIVDPLPDAAFDVLVIGSTADFDNLSANATEFSWDFGDGSSSVEVDPSHEYQSGGLYTVTLISTNNCGSDTAFQTISVASAPVAGVGISPTIGCSPMQVQYSSNGSGDVETYAWSFPGGDPATSSEMDPLVTYNIPGIYNVQLIVTNPVGSDTILVANAVEVQEPVIGAFSFDVNGSTADFINESTGEESYIWEIAGFEYTEENPSVEFAEDGVYAVQLIVTGPCGSDTVVQQVTISTLPIAGVGASATSGCEPFTVQFTDESTSNVIAWEWSFPGGDPSSSNVQNPLITYQTPGVYGIMLTVTSAAGTDLIAINDLITVDPLPDALFGTVQSGTEIEFENTSVDASTYLWLFGDGSSSTEENPVHDYGEFGEYEIQLVATNECGSDTFALNLQLTGLPVPWFTASSEFGCAPFEVQFIDASQNGAEEWDWSFPGGNPGSSTEQNPVVVYAVPGLYDITLSVSNLAGAQSLVREEYIEVGDSPTSEFSSEIDGDQVTFLNLSLDAESYFWDFGDGQTDTVENPVHVYATTGTYTVELIVFNSCGSDTFSIEVTVQTSATVNPESGVHIELWPNPNDGSFNIDFQNYNGDLELTLLDIAGRVVYNESINVPARLEISLEDVLAPGLYHVVIQGKDVREVMRVVVQ
jgi:PKD repeat protein